MYLKEKNIRILKIKNTILMVLGIFFLMVSVSIILSMASYYWYDWETFITAKSIPDSIQFLVIGIVFIIISGISRRNIGNASFYSSYFEGDLDGYISFEELADITGKSSLAIKKELNFFRRLYMKNFEFKTENGMEQIELYSKTAICECKSCGASIEKRVFFTGICPYCKSSDLFAKVLTNHQFYSISNDMQNGRKQPKYYSAKRLVGKQNEYLIFVIITVSLALIFGFMFLEKTINYNNPEYLKDILLSGESYSSYDLIKADMREGMIWSGVGVIILTPAAIAMVKRTKLIIKTKTYAKCFSESETPFVKIDDLPTDVKASTSEMTLKSVRKAIRSGYLRNCSLEKHSGILNISLAKKIVKDQCPTCGASIVGAVDENYVCQYCKNTIMGVVRKK